MGEATYRRIKTIMGVAADENETEEVREVAQTAVAAIDAGAPVRGEYDRVKEVRRKSESVTVETGKPKRANDPTEYIKAMAVLHPTVRIAFDLDGKSKYSSVNSLDIAARRAGITWRFTEKQWQAHVQASSDILARSVIAIEVALSAIAERVDFETITAEQADEALERLASTTALNRIIKTLKEITNV